MLSTAGAGLLISSASKCTLLEVRPHFLMWKFGQLWGCQEPMEDRGWENLRKHSKSDASARLAGLGDDH